MKGKWWEFGSALEKYRVRAAEFETTTHELGPHSSDHTKNSESTRPTCHTGC